MNILFILPFDTTYKYKTAFLPSISYQPLTLPLLAALVPKGLNANITLVDEGVQKCDYSKEYYDIVGISIVTSSANRGYELAGFFKRKGSTVLIGGHHATLMPDEAQNHADSVFVGSAERTFPQFFEDYINGGIKPIYQAAGTHPEQIPFARRELLKSRGYLPQPTIIANYGCSNQCKYCVMHSFWGCNAKRPISEVIDEIKQLGKKEYLFLDPSPLSDTGYAKELYSELAKLKIKWAGLSTLNVADDEELLDLVHKSGCAGLLLGFETFHQNDLNALNKYKNKVDDYKEIVLKLHQRNISILGTFMLGLDNDTKESIRQMPDLIEETKIDVPRFAVMTPYPNTPIYNELEAQGRILTKDWSKYDSIHCVYEPKRMTAKELEYEFLSLWKECYTTKRMIKRLKFSPQMKAAALATNFGFKIYARRLKELIL